MIRTYLHETDKVTPQSVFYQPTRSGSERLGRLLDSGDFEYPKDEVILQRFIEMATDRDSVVMDSFAGSGTTGHAVLAMNKADGGNRRFICIEVDPAIATSITAQRLKKVVEGYHPKGDTKKEKVEGTGGGFQFCKLGKPLFDEAGNIADEVRFADLAAHVFFTETGSPIQKRADGRTPLLGVHQGKAVYLLFNGVLGDKRPDGGNVLTHDVAHELPAHPAGKGERVVYGEACRLGPKSLHRYGITFRQIPFELRVD